MFIETNHYFSGGGFDEFPFASNFFLQLRSLKLFFSKNVAANNFFSKFVSWICDFATAVSDT